MPGHTPLKRLYLPVKTQERQLVGHPLKKLGLVHMHSKITMKDQDWSNWERVVEMNDSELVTFCSMLYLSARIATRTLPAHVKTSYQKYTSENCFYRLCMLGISYPYKLLLQTGA